MIYEGSIFITIAALLFFGAVIGLLFNFFKWEHRQGRARNMGLGIIGAIQGWAFAALLPILPEYRFTVTLAFTMMFSVQFMIAHWMISREKTPIISHDDGYEAAKEEETVEHPAAS